MRIVFRADASRSIGAGHVMRSSVLAEEAISRGYECIYVGTISEIAWLQERILTLGFSDIVSPEDYVLKNNTSDILILDSYSIPIDSPFISTEKWKYILSITDDHTPNYNVGANLIPSLDFRSKYSSNSVVLTGPDYILTRRGMSKSVHIPKNKDSVKVLIVGGGSDPFGFVKEFPKVIDRMISDSEIHCFTDQMIGVLENNELIIHKIGPELDSWANQVDIVFCTASTTCFEFIAREIPIGVFCAVDNQRDSYEQLGKLGYVSQIGELDSLGTWHFELDEISELLKNEEKRLILKKSIHGLIDFKGASRVMDFLESVTQI